MSWSCLALSFDSIRSEKTVKLRQEAVAEFFKEHTTVTALVLLIYVGRLRNQHSEVLLRDHPCRAPLQHVHGTVGK